MRGIEDAAAIAKSARRRVDFQDRVLESIVAANRKKRFAYFLAICTDILDWRTADGTWDSTQAFNPARLRPTQSSTRESQSSPAAAVTSVNAFAGLKDLPSSAIRSTSPPKPSSEISRLLPPPRMKSGNPCW
jgi:hypothetical protein